MTSFFWTNHWKCGTNGGHAILLGFQYSTMADYDFRREYSFELCVLGFALGLKWIPKEPFKTRALDAQG